MPQTLGEELAEVKTRIKETQVAQRYQKGENSVDRAILFRLYAERDTLVEKINMFGSNYIEGQNTEPMGDTSLVSFS